jgi:hypothetical protein
MVSDLPTCAVIARPNYVPVTVAGQWRNYTAFPFIPRLLIVKDLDASIALAAIGKR